MVVADKKTEALKIVEEGIKELESAKGSVTVGVQKLSRVAKLLDDKEIYAWTELQLGSTPYINAIRDLAEKIDEEYEKEEKVQSIDDSKYSKYINKLNELHIPLDEFVDIHKYKSVTSTGGYHSVEFIEERFSFLTKLKPLS